MDTSFFVFWRHTTPPSAHSTIWWLRLSPLRLRETPGRPRVSLNLLLLTVQNVPRRGIFINNSLCYTVTILSIFLFIHCKPQWHKIIIVQHIYCVFIYGMFLSNPTGTFCIHGSCSVCPTAKDRKTDWKCCQCTEWVCKDHSIKTNQIKCGNWKKHSN